MRHRTEHPDTSGPPRVSFPVDRRGWMRAVLGAGAAASGIARHAAAGSHRGDPPLIVRQESPLNAETPTSVFDRFLTPNDRFFIRNHHPTPETGAPGGLVVGGLEGRELAIGLDELAAMEQVTIPAVLQCSGNGRAYYDPEVGGVPWARGAVGNADWTGVRLRDLLDRAGVPGRAAHVQFRGADEPSAPGEAPYIRSLPIDRALHPETLVALRMNGEPLPRDHGGPLRLVVPGWFGNHWLKWLARVDLAAEEAPGPYQQESYRVPRHPIAPGTSPDPSAMDRVTVMPVKSLIARPAEGEVIPGGRAEVVGVAWSGMGAVTRVEVAVGPGGEYLPAELTGPEHLHAWRLWRFSWDPPGPGDHELRCRATDSAGYVQPDAVPWNPKGYLWNGVDRVRVRVS